MTSLNELFPANPFVPAAPNRHPVDELAEVRAAIKKLQVKEDELRQRILSNLDDLDGDEFSATIREKPYNKIDTLALKAAYPDIASQFMTSKPMTTIWIKPRSEPDELGQ